MVISFSPSWICLYKAKIEKYKYSNSKSKSKKQKIKIAKDVKSKCCKKYKKGKGGSVILSNGKELSVSASRKAELLAYFK